MLGQEYSKRQRIVMAGDTRIGALQAVCNIGGRIVVRFCRDSHRQKNTEQCDNMLVSVNWRRVSTC
jgi:hypothetical protein